MLTGIQITSQQVYEHLLTEQQPAWLLNQLGNSGYHRIYAAPGTYQADEEWRNVYSFDEYLLRQDFDYQGPIIGFGAMSDQYMLHRLGQNHLQNNRKEFVLYLLVSSHVPFDTIPLYKEDWNFAGKGTEYYQGYLQSFENNWLTGGELAEGYLAGITYSLESITGYIRGLQGTNGFFLIIGDHQPRKPVSLPNAGFAVPFHLILPIQSTRIEIQNWLLSEQFMPPALPENQGSLPLMAEIPGFIWEITNFDKSIE
jgi:phosphoglycerol transferase MdoB-like AlkP superfamily enzyme